MTQDVKAQHTPGPWFVEKRRFKSQRVRVRFVNGTVAQVSALIHQDANARLIAAAPGLLEALTAMVDEQCDYMRINNLGDPEQQHNIKRARAAIAKATGEQS